MCVCMYLCMYLYPPPPSISPFPIQKPLELLVTVNFKRSDSCSILPELEQKRWQHVNQLEKWSRISHVI